MMQTEADTLLNERSEIRRLSEINPFQTLFKLLLIAAAFAIAFILAKTGDEQQIFLLFIAAFLIITWAQNAILEELHDGSHYRLASSRRTNEYLAGFYGSLIGISLVNF